MGDRRHHLPVLLAEWRPRVHGLRFNTRWLWSDWCCSVASRDGLHVGLSATYHVFIVPTLTTRFPVTLSSEPSTVGLQTLLPLHRASGDSFKVCDLLPHCRPDSDFSPGWVTVSAWMFTAAGATASLANQLSALIIFNHPNYDPKSWHIAFFMWAFILIPLIFNLFFRKLLNTFETIGAILHVTFFIATIVTLSVLAEHSTTDFVFKTIVTDVSGWSNPGISFGIGLLTVVLPLAGEILPNAHFGKELLTINRCRRRSPHEYNLSIRLLCWILC